MKDTRTQSEETHPGPDLTHTQPLETIAVRVRSTLTRRDRLLRTLVFGAALVVGIATVIVIAGNDDVSAPSPTGIFSPSGHLPSTPTGNTNVSISWSPVGGAAGYWWAMVEDPAHLPAPVIRPSGNDRRVFFRFSGRGYFVLRAGFRAGGKLRWSDEVLYGPIVVRDEALSGAEDSTGAGTDGGSSTAPGEGNDTSSGGEAGRSFGGSGGGGGPRPTSVDPRYAGQRGECPPGGGGCGEPGEPGQPAPEAGGGAGGGCQGGSCPGEPGTPGADGPPG
jgi:hypothetical protein